tara:strand:- start:434 stop:628 length:195 start_codon:yes stop_codon:yes gene_type:complete
LSTVDLEHSEKDKLFKIMVKGKDPIASNRGKSGRSSNKTPSGFEADSDPDVIRIEIMSEYDFFF